MNDFTMADTTRSIVGDDQVPAFCYTEISQDDRYTYEVRFTTEFINANAFKRACMQAYRVGTYLHGVYPCLWVAQVSW